MASFEGKVILITGAGSGIGRATAIKLASLGASLALCDISSTGLEPLLTSLNHGPVHRPYTFDVGSSTEVSQAVTQIVKDFGKLTHVFNCAGVNPTKSPLTQTTDAYFDKLLNTNLRGTYNVTRASIPHLSPGSTIVNVSSTAGLRASAGFAIYNATKFGIIGFSKSMALEIGPQQIRVNVVAPGPIETPTNAFVVEGEEAVKKGGEGVALGRLGQPEEVADVVAFLMGEEARFMNGSVVEVSGGI